MQPYGGFWVRVVAYIIDSIILNIASFLVGTVLGFGIGAAAMPGSEEVSMAAATTGGAVGLVLSWLYYAIAESSSWQATPGKKALGLVVTGEQGERIGFGKASGRFFAKILSALILLFGFFMIGWTQRKQGLHDILAHTLVYKAGASRDVLTSPAVFE